MTNENTPLPEGLLSIPANLNLSCATDRRHRRNSYPNLASPADFRPAVEEQFRKPFATRGIDLTNITMDNLERENREREHRMRELREQIEAMSVQLETLHALKDESAENSVPQRKEKPVFSGVPVRQERFPSKGLDRWGVWVKHFKCVAQANGWPDIQSIQAIPACLTGWALEAYGTIPAHMTDYVRGYPAPTLEALLTFLTPRMQQYCDEKILRSEFRFLAQLADESIQDFARRIRIAADGAFGSLPDEARTIHMKEQFLDGLQDHEIQTKMLEDETDRDFAEIVQRAQRLDAIKKTADAIKKTA